MDSIADILNELGNTKATGEDTVLILEDRKSRMPPTRFRNT